MDRLLVLAGVLLWFLIGTPAHANDSADCNQSSNPELTIRGCTKLLQIRGQTQQNMAFASRNRGVAYYKKGDFDRAIADADRAIAVKPDLAEAYYDRSAAYRAKGDYDRAVADDGIAIRLKPDFAEAYCDRGSAYGAKGDYDRAVADYGIAIRLKPDFAEAYNNRGFAFFLKGDFGRAINNASRALVIRPDYGDAFDTRGEAYRAKGDYDRALADFDSAVRLLPDNAEIRFHRGLANQAKGDTASALADFKVAAGLFRAGDKLRETALARIAELEAVPAAPVKQVGAPATAASEFGRRVALVIGNSAYRSVGLLPNPSRDAELVGAALRRTGVEDVTVAHDLDRDGLIAALKAFAQKADAADWAVIYYAGHGIEVGGLNYLVPVDAKLESDRDVPDEAVSLDRILSSIEGAHKLRLVVLDACRNNPFAQQMKRTGASRAIGRGLARVEPTGATLVVYAAKEGTTAADGDSGNSPFAVSFANRVVESGVEINKTFRFVRQDVLAATGNGQEPFVYGSLPPVDFFFVPPK